MPRPKKATPVATNSPRTVKKGEAIVSKTQLQTIEEILDVIADARRASDNISEDGNESLYSIGFTLGRIFEKLDGVEDKLSNLLDALQEQNEETEISLEWE